MNPQDIARLSASDQQALDALMAAGLDGAAVEPAHADRAAQITQLLALLEHLPEERTGDLLTERTLAAIDRARQKERFAEQIDTLSRGRGMSIGFSLPDVAAVAAIFIVGMSLLWPMLESVRATSRQIACQANLGMAGRGLVSYAVDHNGSMPATFYRPGDPWDRLGKFDDRGYAQSNSAHLLVAHSTGYMPLKAVTCPDNPNAPRILAEGARDFPSCESISYSYQNQYTTHRPRITGTVTFAILGDKNPFFDSAKYRWRLDSNTNSFNHTRRGQNALLSDGHVAWMTSPMWYDDNIFHIAGRKYDYYTGYEGPADVDDAFLVP